MNLKDYIRSIPDYPKKGILFRDITTLIKNPDAFKFANDRIIEISKNMKFDKVAAIESRGFIFASALAAQNQNGMIMCRKKGKLPPNSAKNGLELNETFEDMKKNNLYLTEFEASLVAPMMIFQKVMTLPKSRWCGIKDKMILITIEQESINKTLTQLPRTPTDAGLLAVNLKRKMSYKNTHKSELIDPAKIYKHRCNHN